MNKLPQISVLLPCYNAQKYLREAIESILNQTFTDFELILINDGSTDDSFSIINEFAARDERIVVVDNEKNLGLIATLNKGIDLARGHFIARMDADDISGPERFSKQLDYFQQNAEIDLLGTTTRSLDADGNHGNINLLKAKLPLSCVFSSLLTNPFVHGSIMAKAKTLKELKYSSETDALHTEDFEAWSRFALRGKKMANLDEVLYYQRQHESNISKVYEDIQIENFVKCGLKACQTYYKAKYDPLSFRVTVNRLNKNTTPTQLGTGIKLLETLKKDFIFKNKDISKNEIGELNVFIKYQKIDVLTQALLKGRYSTKIRAILLILINLDVILSRSGILYLKNKF